MSREFKYVIVSGLFPRLCSLGEAHTDIAGMREITSAGKAIIRVNPNAVPNLEVSCYGESVGLRVKSNPIHDAELILRMLVEPSYSYPPPAPPQGAPFDEPLPPPPS